MTEEEEIMGNGILARLAEFFDEMSRVTLRFTVICVNIAKVAVMIVLVWLLLRFGVGLFDFMAGLFRTLPQWPR